MDISPRITTPSELSMAIEDIVWEKDVSYFDAVLIYCEQNNLEIESVAGAIKSNAALKSKIQMEAEDLNFLKKRTHRLPI